MNDSSYILLFAFLSISLLIQSCDSDNKAESSDVVDICNCDDLRYDELYNVMHILGVETPFTGTCEYRYNEDQVKEARKYVEGKMHGEMKTWHPNGQLAIISNFKKNLQHGELKEFDDQGNLVRHADYQNGKFIGFVKGKE